MPLKNAPMRTRKLLGKLLEARRLELSPDYYDRTVFVAATGINDRLSQDVETAGPPSRPRNVTPATMRDKVGPAYQVTPESIEETISSGEDRLEAAPGSPPRRPRQLPPPPEDRTEAGPPAEPRQVPPILADALADRRITRLVPGILSERAREIPPRPGEEEVWDDDTLALEWKPVLVALMRAAAAGAVRPAGNGTRLTRQAGPAVTVQPPWGDAVS